MWLSRSVHRTVDVTISTGMEGIISSSGNEAGMLHGCIKWRTEVKCCLPEVPDIEATVCSTGSQYGLIMR